MDEAERVYVENFCAGINTAASKVVIYPAEFYITMTSFEDYTPLDVWSTNCLLAMFLTKDWHQEFLRERLTAIYDRELVDKLLPFQYENYYPLENMHTISDENLKIIGMYEEGNAEKLFSIDYDLLHLRNKTNDKLEIKAELEKEQLPYSGFFEGWETLGSNCWAVHGNFTKSGKPMLSCDPHLAKGIFSTWYPTRISWNETTFEDSDEGPK